MKDDMSTKEPTTMDLATGEIKGDCAYPALMDGGAKTIALLREYLDGEIIGLGNLDRVKMPAGGGTRWEVPTLEGSEMADSVDGVIIHTRLARAYWEQDYQGGSEPPECSSQDGRHGQPTDAEAWLPPAEALDDRRFNCVTCANSQWGSAKTGRGQACKLTRLLFVLTSESTLPVVISLPPSSTAVARQYLLRLAARSTRITDVITSVGLERVKGDGVPDYSRAVLRASTAKALSEGDRANLAAYAEQLRPLLDRVHVEPAESAETTETT